MIDRFAIAATGNLLFGDGTFSELDNQVALRGFAHAALLSSRTFSSTERFSHAVEALRDRGIGVSVIPVSGEPTVASIDRISKAVADAGCDVVVGIGGGSALDSAKAVAVMALQLAKNHDPISVKRYLEGVGDLTPPAERRSPPRQVLEARLPKMRWSPISARKVSRNRFDTTPIFQTW
jgi:alcohol dehydrogenase class IV